MNRCPGPFPQERPICRECFLVALCVLLAVSSQACPFCGSKTGKEIRASLFGPDLPYNLLVLVSPFLIFAAIVYGIYCGGFSKKRFAKREKTQRL